jgi:7,8-dihydro-6-hydroxymethylpterin-pyrophosphokinase
VLDPKVWTYAFVAVPLAELLPELRNPESGETLEQAARRLAEGARLTPRADIPFGKITTGRTG